MGSQILQHRPQVIQAYLPFMHSAATAAFLSSSIECTGGFFDAGRLDLICCFLPHTVEDC